MKFSIFLVGFLATLQLTLAQRVIDGFDLLGPKPPTGRASSELKYYYISTGSVASKTWLDAFDACYLSGGQLATPFTSAQDQALSQYMLSAAPGVEWVWVGGRSTTSGATTYRWLTVNLPVTYTNWGLTACMCNIDSINNGCMYVSHSSNLLWYWCATSCTELHRYVCEI